MRLFIALRFNDDFKDGVCRVQNALRRVCPSGTLTRRENLHLTVAFLGECGEEMLGEIESAMLACAQESFVITSGKVGAFGHGDVRWLGIEENPPLKRLAANLAENLEKMGFRLEKRDFVPHITLGRSMVLPAAFDENSLPTGKFSQRIERFELLESRQINGQTEYNPIFSVNFR